MKRRTEIGRKSATRLLDLYIGERIRARRTKSGLSQEALGDKIKRSMAQVSRYESGESSCEAALLVLIAQATGCKATYFLTGIEEAGGGK